jgi:WD40 repeat protein
MNAARSKSSLRPIAPRARSSESPLVALLLVSLVLAGAAADEPPRTDLYGDPLPAGAIARLGTVRLRHDAPSPNALVFSPDGKTIASAYGHGDNSVRLWDVATGKLLWRVDRQVKSIAFSPDGRLLVCGSERGHSAVLSARDGSPMSNLEQGAIRINAVAFSGDGQTIALGGLDADWRVKVIRAADLSTVSQWRLPGIEPDTIAISSDGKRIAVGDDGKYALLNVDTGAIIREWKTPHSLESYLGFVPGTGELATVNGESDPATVQLWNGETGELVRTVDERKGPLRGLAISRDGRFLLTLCGPQRVELVVHDLDRAAESRTIKVRQRIFDPLDGAVALAPDGITAATAGLAIRFWRLQTGDEVRPFPPPISLDAFCEFSRDGEYFASRDQIWSTSNGTPLNPRRDMARTGFSEDGDPFLTEFQRAALHITSLASSDRPFSLPGTDFWIAPAHGYVIKANTTNGNGGSNDHPIELWKLGVQEPLARIPNRRDLRDLLQRSDRFTHAAAISPRHDQFAWLTGNGDVEVFDWTSGEQRRLKSFRSFTNANWYGAIAWSPDAAAVVAQYRVVGNPACIWNLNSDESPTPIAGAPYGTQWQQDLPWIGFAPTGKRVLFYVIRADSYPTVPTFMEYDLHSGVVAGSIELKSGRLGAAEPKELLDYAASPSGEVFANSLDPRFVRVNGGHRDNVSIRRYFAQGMLAMTQDRVLTFLPNPSNPGIDVWETATRRRLLTLRPEPSQGRITLFATSPKSRYLLTAFSDGTALVWDLGLCFQNCRFDGWKVGDLWELLSESDPLAARQAVEALIAKRGESTLFLADQQPPAAVDKEHIEELVEQLDSDAFADREQAAKRLEQIGAGAIPLITSALRRPISPEQQARLRDLLESAKGPIRNSEILRFLRAVQVLEAIGDESACSGLAKYARPANDPRVTQAASEALKRLTSADG